MKNIHIWVRYNDNFERKCLITKKKEYNMVQIYCNGKGSFYTKNNWISNN